MDRTVLTLSQWRDWKGHPVTRVFMEELMEHASNYVSALATGAGTNSLEDRYKVGFIAGLGIASDWKPQLIEDE